MGYNHKLKSGNTMDTYVKYLYAHQGGEDTSLSYTNEEVNFKPIESHRVRTGFRYVKTVDTSFKAYGGLAYEYEFSNEAGATTQGLAISEPNLKGGSGMAELGISYKKAGNPLSFDFTVTGTAGKRESISAALTGWYEIGKRNAKKAGEKVTKATETKKTETQAKTIEEAQCAQQKYDWAKRFETIFGGKRPETQSARSTSDAKRKPLEERNGTLPETAAKPKKTEVKEQKKTERISRPEKPEKAEKPQTFGYDTKTGEVGGLGVLESPLLITR